MPKKFTREEFIDKAIAVHGSRYDYSLVEYKRAHSKVVIVCKEHGKFTVTPNNHLSGQNCQKCIGNKQLTTDEFILKSHVVHGNKYDYSLVRYTSNKLKVTIICPIHGEFLQQANSHMEGCGCPGCATYGFDTAKPGYIYYLKVVAGSQELYKIGITNRTINERFSLIDLKKVEVIKQKLYLKGIDALKLEASIKRQYKQYQYKGGCILESGNTELFTVDIDSLSPLF